MQSLLFDTIQDTRLYGFYQTKICVKIFGIENVYNSAIEIIYIIYIISMNSAHTL